MSAGKHTPGPWFVDHKSPFLVRAHDDIDGRHIAHVGPANYVPRFDVDEPNARLIAAAPELLEALQSIVENYGYSSYPSDEDKESSPEVVAARAAIAKATGSAK